MKTNCLVVLLSSISILAARETPFKHPSVYNSKELLDAISTYRKYNDYKELKAHIDSLAIIFIKSDSVLPPSNNENLDHKLDYKDFTNTEMTPFAMDTVWVTTHRKSKNWKVPSDSVMNAHRLEYSQKVFYESAHFAYGCALLWTLTGDNAYYKNAKIILNRWASTFDDFSDLGSFPLSQKWLVAAWTAPIWVAAADIVRYYSCSESQWSKDEIMTFDLFLNKVISHAWQARKMANNWCSSAILARICVAVYQNDRDSYNEALALYVRKLESTNSDTTGLFEIDWNRDPAHSQYTLIALTQIGEIAWNQGDSVYMLKFTDDTIPRLANLLEMYSKRFNGKMHDPKFTESYRTAKYRNSNIYFQGYAISYRHYIIRMGLDRQLPEFYTMYSKWRLNRVRDDMHFIGWDIITHAEY